MIITCLDFSRDKGQFSDWSNFDTEEFSVWAGALVQWLWEETHVVKVVGSNPGTIKWMDFFSHIFVVKIKLMLV